jgi:hypothetical protein
MVFASHNKNNHWVPAAHKKTFLRHRQTNAISLLCGTKRVHLIETESKKVAKGGEG